MKNYLLHPVIFIFPEGIIAGETKIIQNSPKMEQIYDKAIDLHVSIKFFDPQRDSQHIKPEDYFVVFGKMGEKLFSMLQNMGSAINMLEL